MWFLIQVIYESIVQAVQQLSGNKLRSLLSSLGITIGIFCIISVLSAVDSLEQNIKQSFEKLGNDVVYVDRMTWAEDPGSNWWKYARRPYPSLSDLEAIQERVTGAEAATMSVFIPGKTVKYHSSSVEGAYMSGITEDYGEINRLEFSQGRYFTHFEFANGTNRLILGYKLAEELFPNTDAANKEVSIVGRKFTVVGVLKEEGNSLVSIIPYDEAILVPMQTARKLVNLSSNRHWGTLLSIKAKEGVNLEDLTDEVTGILRSHRSIRPKEEANFAVNELSIFTKLLQPIFTVLNVVGLCIGLFAIIVGMFSVANIMFVSVKERTNIIGIKKALGARKSVILLEFLIESVILCIFGGLVGLLLVIGILQLVSGLFGYEMFVSTGNVIFSLLLALAIGVISGIIPALQAARMDPVDAIRSK